MNLPRHIRNNKKFIAAFFGHRMNFKYHSEVNCGSRINLTSLHISSRVNIAATSVKTEIKVNSVYEHVKNVKMHKVGARRQGARWRK